MARYAVSYRRRRRRECRVKRREPDNVQVVTSPVCPMCNGVGEIPND